MAIGPRLVARKTLMGAHLATPHLHTISATSTTCNHMSQIQVGATSGPCDVTAHHHLFLITLFGVLFIHVHLVGCCVAALVVA